MHAKYEVCISYGSKVIGKVKVDNRQTGQNQYNKDDHGKSDPIKYVVVTRLSSV